MKKLLTLFFGLGLLSQQAGAVMVLGENFAGYANSVMGTGGSLYIDDGTGTSSDPNYSNLASDIANNITDVDAASWVIGHTAGTYLDLGLSAGVTDGAGMDMKVFLVGGNGHTFDMTVGSVTKTYTISPYVGATGSFDDIYHTDPIIGMAIDLADFSLTGPVDHFRITIGDGWCTTSTICSAVPSFIGTYNSVSAVPVPAAVWLFGSGLLGLTGLVRRRRS